MRYRDIIGGRPWRIRVCILGREVLYWWIPLRISIGTHMGLWIRWGHRAEVQACIFCWPWWKPQLHIWRNRFRVGWRWECGPVTISRYR